MANYDGVVYVGSRMQWYCELANLLLKDDTGGAQTAAKLRDELEQRLIDLYQALLLFLIKNICYCFRNRLIATLRDFLMLDNWSGALASIKTAENSFRRDKDNYNTEIQKITTENIRLTLQDHLNVAKRVETDILQGFREIQSVLQEQVLIQEQQLSIQEQQLSIQEQEKSAQLQKEDNQCLIDLRITDPSADKEKIEERKGGLLNDSYRWILENGKFQNWQDQQSRLLWINGDPGKGKTMLLCGIINEIESSKVKKDNLSYFFCQAKEPTNNKATCVLRGLLYLLVSQQTSLIPHIRKKYDSAGKPLFEDHNSLTSLSSIFRDILQDLSLNSTYLIIDALDECGTEMLELLEFIANVASLSSRVKWVVSSRPWPKIRNKLKEASNLVDLSLEFNKQDVSIAVDTYIRFKVTELARCKEYDEETRNTVQNYLLANAKSTFLWVALVYQNLMDIDRWETSDKLKEFPPGLYPLYHRMLEQIEKSDKAVLYKQILASNAVVNRPVTLKELTSLVKMPEGLSRDLKSLEKVIGSCGSFLTIREGTIHLVHESAQNYLDTDAAHKIFPDGKETVHYEIFSRSLPIISSLKRNIYQLPARGYPIEQIKRPSPDPLEASSYSCVYWIHHLCDSYTSTTDNSDLQDGGKVDLFFRKSYLYWLEALSLCRCMSEGVLAMAKLEALIQVGPRATELLACAVC